MTSQRTTLVLFASLIAIGAWVACKSDYDAETPSGGERQPCFANGTCLASFTCLSNVCVVAADAATASSASSSSTSSASSASSSGTPGTSASSSSGDAGSEAGSEHELCGNLSPSGHAICPAEPKDDDCTGLKSFCCVGTGCTDKPTCAPSTPDAFQCFSSDHCDTGKRCCITGKIGVVTLACGLSVALEPGNDMARSTCSALGDSCAPGFELCSPGGTGCLSGACQQTLFRLKAPNGKVYTRTLHVCR